MNSIATEPVVRVDNVYKVFGGGRDTEVVAVNNVSFSVDSSWCLGIVGESGSGKTTLARMLAGVERPTSGTVSVAGRDRAVRKSSRRERLRRARELQLVFQDPYSSLDPRQSAAAALAEVLGLHFPAWSSAQQQKRIGELADLVGLSDRQIAAKPAALSGGQRQRVAIARALAADPEVVVLDEAVSGLDVSIQAQILNLLADIQKQTSVAYIFISHDLAVVRQIADEVLVMQKGTVVEHGATAEVLDNPRSDYTRRLRAAVPGPGWTPKRQPRPAPDL